MPTKGRVFGLAFVASVEPSTAGQPGHGSLHHPAVPAQSVRGLDALVRIRLGRPSVPGPRRERRGGMPRTSGSRPWLWCMFAPETPRDSGSPVLSVIRQPAD